MFLTRAVTRILAYRRPVDMRKSFDGLIALVQNTLREDPLSGDLYVFINRRGNYVKSVYWDRTGFSLFAKRLERGRFIMPGESESFELTEKAFRWLLDGIVVGRGKRLG